MGAAQSSNAAEAVSNVSNFINNSTTASTNQSSRNSNVIDLDNCALTIGGKLDVKASNDLRQKNTQIVTASQDSNVTNNFAQQVQQTATSSMGALGIGYASASNSTSQMINSTNQIFNAMKVGCSQYSSINNNFTCGKGTKITAANLKISFDNTTDFMASQTLNNTQVATVVNDISQSISQTASATVEGVSAMLFMIILIIGVIIYFAMKPLSSEGATSAVAAGGTMGIITVIILMYLGGTPPFFNDPKQCINNSNMGMGCDSTTGSCPECSKQVPGKIPLAQPPIRYIYALTPNNTSRPGSDLLRMSIASKSGQTSASGSPDNGGYSGSTYTNITNAIFNQQGANNYTAMAAALKIPMIPNPLVMVETSINSYTNSGDKARYFKIPKQYSRKDPSETDAARCTPGTVQVGSTNDETDFNKCPTFADPNSWDNDQTTDVIDDAIANLNLEEWQNYLTMNPNSRFGPGVAGYTDSDEAEARSLFARFVLCDIGSIGDLHLYVKDNEYIKFVDSNNNLQYMLARDAKENPEYSDSKYFYHPYSLPASWSNGIVGSGYITGSVGVVDDNSHKYDTAMKDWGGWTLLALFGGTLLIVILIKIKNKITNKDKGEEENN